MILKNLLPKVYDFTLWSVTDDDQVKGIKTARIVARNEINAIRWLRIVKARVDGNEHYEVTYRESGWFHQLKVLILPRYVRVPFGEWKEIVGGI
jgi:hypothetical protein